jgi:glycosyltransferase involved in cell wall biosynthesis
VTTRRATVIRIIDRLNVGGPAIHAILTSKRLDPQKYRTILVIGEVESTEADMEYLLEDSGIDLICIPSLGRELRPFRDMVTAIKLLSIMVRERPQIVHTHKSKAGVLGRLAALVAGVPVRVHTFHGHVFNGYFGPLKTFMFLSIERLLAAHTSKLIALSPRLVDELSNKFRISTSDRFAIVPLGFDLEPFADCEQFKGALRHEIGVSPSTKLVGIVGRMVPVKDHATFIEAAARLSAVRGDVHFVFVGAGELEAQVRSRLGELGLESRSHLLGWRRNLERIYADLDVVALSSVNEGTPVALVEAMAAGVPVAATAVGGVPDLLRDGAWGQLARVKDSVDLAHAIDRALQPAAREQATVIRRQAMACYGGDRLCGDLDRLYEALLSNAAWSFDPSAN